MAEHIQRDWEDRLFTENLSTQIKRIVDFLNKFDISARDKLAKINEKIIKLDRQITYLEAVNSSLGTESIKQESIAETNIEEPIVE